MSREKFAEKIHWTQIIWIVSVLNPLMIVPQLWQIMQTHQTTGLSLVFLAILLFVQGGFGLHGFFTKDRFIMGSNILAATMTLLTIILTLYFRYFLG